MCITPLALKNCAHAAHLHQAAFYKGWAEKDFQDFLNDPLVFGLKIEKKTLLSKRYPVSPDCHAELVSASKKRSRNKFGMTTECEILCGYILWREIEDEAEILTLVIDPSFQGQGLGNRLLRALFRRLKEKEITKLFLEVAEDNNSAQSFYIKNGFTILGKRPSYYERPENNRIDGLNFSKVIE